MVPWKQALLVLWCIAVGTAAFIGIVTFLPDLPAGLLLAAIVLTGPLLWSEWVDSRDHEQRLEGHEDARRDREYYERATSLRRTS